MVAKQRADGDVRASRPRTVRSPKTVLPGQPRAKADPKTLELAERLIKARRTVYRVLADR